MKTLHKRCAGLDVHKAEVVACLRVVTNRKVAQEVRRFPTTTHGLLELTEWLERGGCTHVAMEATGVYWKPVWHILEGHFALILANAAHMKNVPGRKSDVSDATWLADLLAHGLIRSSFVPPPAIQELRDLFRMGSLPRYPPQSSPIKGQTRLKFRTPRWRFRMWPSAAAVVATIAADPRKLCRNGG